MFVLERRGELGVGERGEEVGGHFLSVLFL